MRGCRRRRGCACGGGGGASRRERTDPDCPERAPRPSARMALDPRARRACRWRKRDEGGGGAAWRRCGAEGPIRSADRALRGGGRYCIEGGSRKSALVSAGRSRPTRGLGLGWRVGRIPSDALRCGMLQVSEAVDSVCRVRILQETSAPRPNRSQAPFPPPASPAGFAAGGGRALCAGRFGFGVRKTRSALREGVRCDSGCLALPRRCGRAVSEPSCRRLVSVGSGGVPGFPRIPLV